MRRRCLVVAVGLGCLVPAPGALAQSQAPPDQTPEPPAGPSPPDLVLSGRDVRLTRAGFAHVTIGCRQTNAAGEACLGTLTVRLSKPVMVDVGGHQKRVPVTRNIGTANFQTPVGAAAVLTLRIDPTVQRAVRADGSLIVQLIGTYVSRAGQAGSAKRSASLYFPTRPPGF
ncbi:MAG: hypothetical protein M3155_08710 [Actinomycetota bacterium]|nr:hypothetical protein [Actinomycetota bacterium]